MIKPVKQKLDYYLFYLVLPSGKFKKVKVISGSCVFYWFKNFNSSKIRQQFSTITSLNVCKCMQFDIKNGVSCSHCKMNLSRTKNFLKNFHICIFDNIMVHGKTQITHDTNLKQFLRAAKKKSTFLKNNFSVSKFCNGHNYRKWNN